MATPAFASFVDKLYQLLKDRATSEPEFSITLREVMKVQRRHAMFFGQQTHTSTDTLSTWADTLFSFLASRSSNPESFQRALWERIEWARASSHSSSSLAASSSSTVSATSRVSQGTLGRIQPLLEERSGAFRFSDGLVSLSFSSKQLDPERFELLRQFPAPFQLALIRLVFACYAGEPVLLIGPTCYKTRLVKEWALLFQRPNEKLRQTAMPNLRAVHLTTETEAADLVGYMYPMNTISAVGYLKDLVEKFCQRASELTPDSELHRDHLGNDQLDSCGVQLVQLAKVLAAATQQKNRHQPTQTQTQTHSPTGEPPENGRTEDFSVPFSDEDSIQIEVEEDDEASGNFAAAMLSSDSESSDEQNGLDQYGWQDNPSPTINSSALRSDSEGSELDDPFLIGEVKASKSSYSDSELDDPFLVAEEKESKSSHSGSPPSSSDQVDDPFLDETGTDEQSQDDEILDPFIDEGSRDERAFLPSIDSQSTRSRDPIVTKLLDALNTWDDLFERRARNNLPDVILSHLRDKFRAVFNSIKTNLEQGRVDPIFVFVDGPISEAVAVGRPVLLEDYNLPKASATERLNPLLEPDPTFTLQEDITVPAAEIRVSKGLQVIATLFANQTTKVMLSSAALSRFTQIRVEPYSKDDVKNVLRSDAQAPKQAILFICAFVDHFCSQYSSVSPSELLPQLLRVVDYLHGVPRKENVIQNVILALKCFVLEQHQDLLKLEEEKREILVSSFNAIAPGLLSAELVESIFPHKLHLDDLARIFTTDSETMITYSLGPIPILLRKPLKCEQELFERMNWVPIPSMVKNFGRVAAAVNAGAPMLLLGPPAAGKTATVQAVCAVLGVPCERISMSASTTPEQLFGSVVPRFNKAEGKRVFEWQNGVLVRALLEGKHILFDEINLAPPELLNRLAVLFHRKQEFFQLPATAPGPLPFNELCKSLCLSLPLEQVRQLIQKEMIRSDGTSAYPDIDELDVEQLNAALTLLMNSETAQPTLTKDDRDALTQAWTDAFHTRRIIQLCNNNRIDLTRTSFFATMNPASIGGGRSQLPRSIVALFTQVEMEAYKPEENRLIGSVLLSRFTDAPPSSPLHGILSKSQLEQVFSVHEIVKALIDRREIGHVGGPYELNLRDLEKLQKVMLGNARDTRRALESSGQEHGASLSNLLLRQFLDLIYAQRFLDPKDQQRVRTEIAARFAVSEKAQQLVQAQFLKKSPYMLRIGMTYIPLGNLPASSAKRPLVTQTPQTLARLSLLAAACQSRSSILLQGPTASGKTSLVQELARLAQQHLVIVPMHGDLEASDLIGQWIPFRPGDDETNKTSSQFIQSALESKFRTLMHVILTHVIASLKDINLINRVNGFLAQIVPALQKLSSAETVEPVQYMSAAVQTIKKMLITIKFVLTADFELTNVSLKRSKRVDLTAISGEDALPHPWGLPERAISALEAIESDMKALGRQFKTSTGELNDNEITFVFVQSEFLDALKVGHWILLDSINCAPPEVIERLNSLTEANPTLNVYEDEQSRELRLGDGIARSHRLFFTCNPSRASAQRLSTAFLNRMLVLWLNEVDTIKDLDLKLLDSRATLLLKEKQVDLFAICLDKLPSWVSGAEELAALFVLFHAMMRDKIAHGSIELIDGFSVTVRNCLEAVFSTSMFLDSHRDHSPLEVAVWAIAQTYIGSVPRQDQKKTLALQLEQLVANLFAQSIFRVPQRIPRSDQDQVKHLGKRISLLMFDIERFLCSLLIGSLWQAAKFGTGKALVVKKSMLASVLVFLNAAYPRKFELNARLQHLRSFAAEIRAAADDRFHELHDRLEPLAPTFLPKRGSSFDDFVADVEGNGGLTFLDNLGLLEEVLDNLFDGASFFDCDQREAIFIKADTLFSEFLQVGRLLTATFEGELVSNNSVKLAQFLTRTTYQVFALLESQQKWRAIGILHSAQLVQQRRELFNSFDSVDSRASSEILLDVLSNPVLVLQPSLFGTTGSKLSLECPSLCN